MPSLRLLFVLLPASLLACAASAEDDASGTAAGATTATIAKTSIERRLSPPVAEVELKFLGVRGMLDEIELAAEGSRERAEALGRAVQTVRDLRSVQGNPDEEPIAAAPMGTVTQASRGQRMVASSTAPTAAPR